jgi:hypothetical protein
VLKNKCTVCKRNKFFRSDITVIILHCQKLILYDWRHYLSVQAAGSTDGGYENLRRVRSRLLLEESLESRVCGSVHLQPTTAGNTTTSAFTRQPEAATAV